jgi:hypothetical protein
MNIPSIAGKTIGSDASDNLMLHAWVSGGSSFAARSANVGLQNGTFDIWGIQIEEGSYATPYEQKSYADELRDCMRYYEVRDCNVNAGGDLLAVCWATGAVAVAPWQYIVPKRVAPTISFPVNGNARFVSPPGGATAGKTITYVNRNTQTAVLNTSDTYGSAGAGWIDGFTVAASAEL